MIQTKRLDVIVLDKESFIHDAKKGMFLKLDSLKAHVSKDAPFVKVNKGDDTHSYGIRIDNNPLLMGAGYNTNGKVIGILANTQHQKLSAQFIKWLFNYGR